MIDAQTEPWGNQVTTVEIKDRHNPQTLQHANARQAEAERERRAKIINAEGEAQAATRLADAADVIGRNPTTLQLRYLQTLREIGGNQNSTVVFPVPIDLVGTRSRPDLPRPGRPARRRPRARRRPAGAASTARCAGSPGRSGRARRARTYWRARSATRAARPAPGRRTPPTGAASPAKRSPSRQARSRAPLATVRAALLIRAYSADLAGERRSSLGSSHGRHRALTPV